MPPSTAYLKFEIIWNEEVYLTALFDVRDTILIYQTRRHNRIDHQHILAASGGGFARPRAAAARFRMSSCTLSLSGSSRRSSWARLVFIRLAISLLVNPCAFIASPICQARTRFIAWVHAMSRIPYFFQKNLKGRAEIQACHFFGRLFVFLTSSEPFATW